MVWRELGGSIAIQCRIAGKEPKLLNLKRGLDKKEAIFSTNSGRIENTTSKKVEKRMLVDGTFPNLTFTITNLIMEDTGPYWCLYTTYGKTMETKEGIGAVLLVVKGEPVLTERPVNSGTIIRGLCCFIVRHECCVC